METEIKKLIKKYWEQRGKDYDKSPTHTDLRDIWKSVLSKIFDKKRRILDVGTGTGFLALILAELGHEVVGIDISRQMLKVAKEKARKAKVSVEFRQGDAENLPFKSESFDAVICRHLLWTLPNPERAVKEWKRVLKDGGRVIAIDGRWDNKHFDVKRCLGRILVAIYEKRNIWKNYSCMKEVRKNLPFQRGLSVEKAIELFKNSGLVDVSARDLSWIRKAMLKQKPFFYRLALSDKAYFMIEAFKEVS